MWAYLCRREVSCDVTLCYLGPVLGSTANSLTHFPAHFFKHRLKKVVGVEVKYRIELHEGDG